MSYNFGYLGNDASSGNSIKDRLLIALTDTSYDDYLQTSAQEASRLIDTFLEPYEQTLPLNNTIPEQIKIICADFATSIFKRRMMPEDVKLEGALQPDISVNVMIASGWFAQGIKKLEEYIKNHYAIKGISVTSINNPLIYLNLLKSGSITLKEARTFITDANTAITNVIKNYITNKQKHFAFISGNSDSDGYKVDSNSEGS